MSALAVIRGSASTPALPGAQPHGFDFSHLRAFSSIPTVSHDIVTMRGLVAVYDKRVFGGIEMGKLYVRESQRPAGGQSWQGWLEGEVRHSHHMHQPFSQLCTSREVVQAVAWPHEDSLAFRLASGFTDGPYQAWAYGSDIIGEVVGLYLPGGEA